MTAPEPTPTAEHIDAVALMLADLDHYRRGNTLPAGTLGAVYRERAVRVLTSTNPRVHEALAANLPADVMLAALVRAGVLTEEWALRYEHDTDPTMDDPSGVRTQTSRVASRAIAEQAVATRVPGGTIRNRRAERQYVTRWEVAP